MELMLDPLATLKLPTFPALNLYLSPIQQDPAMILVKLVAETGLPAEHNIKADLIPGLPAVPLPVVIPEAGQEIILPT